MKRKLFLLLISAVLLICMCIICMCITILAHSMANPTNPADNPEQPLGDAVQEHHITLQWKQFCGYEGTPYEFDIVPILAYDDGTIYTFDATDDTQTEPCTEKFPGVELQTYYNHRRNEKLKSLNERLRDMYHKILADDFFPSDACLTDYYVQIHRTVGMLSFSIVCCPGQDAMAGQTSRCFCFNLDTENGTGMSLYDMVSEQELREKAGMMLLGGNSAQVEARNAEECLEQFFSQEDSEHDWYMTTEELCLIVHGVAGDGDTLLRVPFDRLSLNDCYEKILQEELKPDSVAAEFSYGGNQGYQLYFGFDKKRTTLPENPDSLEDHLIVRPYVHMADSDSEDKINQIIEAEIKERFADTDKYTKRTHNEVYPLDLKNTQDILSITYEWSYTFVSKEDQVSGTFESHALNIDLEQLQKVNLYDLVAKEEIRKQAEEGNLTLTYGTEVLASSYPYAELMDSFLEWSDKQCYDDWYLTPDTYGTIHALPQVLAYYAYLEFPRGQGD